MSYSTLKNKVDSIFKNLSLTVPTSYGSTIESIYETLVLTRVILEYVSIHGTIARFVPPANGRPNYGGTQFHTDNAYEIEFQNGELFYFAQNIYVLGLPYPQGANDIFEVDVIVIKGTPIPPFLNGGYPFPDFIDSVYECKYGAYHKSHLRELVGTKRHLTYLTSGGAGRNQYPFNVSGVNSQPDIPLILMRPRVSIFLSAPYANMFNIGEVIYT